MKSTKPAQARRAAWIVGAISLLVFGAVISAPAASAQTPTHAKAAETFGAPSKAYGSSSAPIKIEVFSDYECPSCRALFEETLRPMINEYVSTGKVYLIHRDFPLPMHKYGYNAAQWANAAARIGQFPNVEAALYDNQAAWSTDGNIEKYVAAAVSPTDLIRIKKMMQGCDPRTGATVKAAAAQIGQSCSVDPYIEIDREMGNKIPVQATPTYVITYKGKKLPAGSGVVSWPIMKQFLDSLLAQ
jgi:protein-disulfide isomerase